MDSPLPERGPLALLTEPAALSPEAERIWALAAPHGQEGCPLKSFCEVYLRGVREGGVSFDRVDMLCLATIFCDPGDDEELPVEPTVTYRQFGLFLQHFGPLDKSLEKIRDVLTSGVHWFHGAQSRQASERLLLGQNEEKRFLLRYSSNPGAFTVDYIKNNKICHFNNIRNDPLGGVDVVVGQPPAQQTYKYSNLSTFISKNQHIFKDPCLNPRSHFQALKLRIANAHSFRSLDDFLAGPFYTESDSGGNDSASGEDSSDSDLEDEDEDDDDVDDSSSPRSPKWSKDKRSGSVDKKPKKLSKEGSDKEAKRDKKQRQKKERKSKLKAKGKTKTGKAKVEVGEADPRYDKLVEEAYKIDKRSLDLKSADIGPELPLQICRLEDLVHVDLSHNNLTELPDALGNLHRLKSLDLSDNKLTVLNPVLFHSFKKLSSLICADNLLTALPESLFEGSCRNTISHLDFSCNQITTVSKAISKIKYKLQFLDLSLNTIEKLPQSIAKLTYLEEFYIKGNHLKALPKKMSSMISLMVLDIADNQIVELPEDLFSLIQVMSGFVLITTGNPIDSKAIDARITQRTAMPKTKSAMDFFDVLKMVRTDSSRLSVGNPTANNDVILAPNSQHPLSARTTASPAGPASRPSKGPDLSLWKQREGYRIERPTEDPNGQERPPVVLQEHFTSLDYRRFFYQRTVHTNIIGSEKKLGPVCISIQKECSHYADDFSAYRALVRTVEGDRVLEIPSTQVKLRKKERYARSNDLMLALKKHMGTTSKLPMTFKHLYVVRDGASHQAFAELEDKLQVNSFKFGVLYAKDGQDESAMYNNVEASPGFEEFLELLGEKIEMQGWSKYAAGLDNTRPGKSVYTNFHDHEIMFHVCTYLPYLKKTDELMQQWDRKRHIGNDIALIVYYDGSKPLDPGTFESQYNHVFALVRPEPETKPTRYTLHMAYKDGVSTLIDMRPPLPPDATFEKGAAFREYLLTKLINAERCAFSTPRFAKPAQRVRSTLFLELQRQFPKQKETQKFRIARTKKRSTTPRSTQAVSGTPSEDDIFEPEEDNQASLRSEYMTPALALQIVREIEVIEKQEAADKKAKGQ